MLKITRSFIHIAKPNLKGHSFCILEQKRNAGHSKWQNIRHTKAAKDGQKSLLFNKMSRLIRLAVQEGGPDPNANFQLANTIAQAKKLCVPAATIQNVIKQTKDVKGNAKSLNYELRGPGGCTVIVSTLSDNTALTRSTLNNIVKKNNCSYMTGAIPGIFDHKGIIEVNPPEKITLEEAVEHAIEVGAEEVTELESEETVFQFICEPMLIFQVKGKLEKLCYKIKQAECEFIPKMQVSLSDADIQAVKKLFDKLDDEPDVVRLYDKYSVIVAYYSFLITTVQHQLSEFSLILG